MEMSNRVGVNVKQNRKNSERNIVSELLSDYCSSSNIHGIGYLGAKDKNLTEKIWWVIAVILSIIFCGILIGRTWNKWQNSPVILSFEQEQTAIWEIPFPAVTICPVNKIQQYVYNYTEMFRNREELKGEERKKFWDVSLICNLNEFEINSTSCTDNVTDNNVYKNIRNVSPAQSDVIFIVKWQEKVYQEELARQFFSEQITQDGICFTFNAFNQYDMYTKELNHEIVYINHTKRNSGFKLEEGYPSGSSIWESYPRRIAKDGSVYGLRIRMTHIGMQTDYVCGSMISGYKIVLHNPTETPRPAQQYILVPLKKQVAIGVSPELTTTSENLRSISPSGRKCYFSNEKSLRFYKVYTQNNCRTECTVNVTQHTCGCVPFHMPHDKSTPICGFGRMDCVLETEVKMLDYEVIEKGMNASSEIRKTEAYKIFEKCNCLPSCADLQYSAEISQTELHAIKSMLATGFAETTLHPLIIEFFESGLMDMTGVDIFFKESQFLALHRSELYGQTDFLANCGGLLGLFMGFSLLSLIEIFYFMTIRLWFKWRNRRKTQLQQNAFQIKFI